MKLTEKQKLRKRLTAFVGMIGEDIKTLDAELVTRINETVEHLSATTKVVIGGLSDSHHFALAELVIGAPLFSSEAEQEKCPSIQVRYGKEPKTHAIFGDTRKTYPGVALSLALGGKAPDAIGLEIPNPIAADIGFTILPPYDGDDNRGGYLVNLLDDTETIIWCSDAAQPWQPKERRLWFTVPDTLKERSILALTGAEHVADDAARTALNEKRAFVEGDFAHMTPVFIDAAKASYIGGKVTEPTQFKSSGGALILQQLTELVQSGQETVLQDARELRVELDKIPLGSSQPVPLAPLPSVAKTADASPEEALKATLLTGANRCRAAVGECTKNEFAPLFDAVSELLSDAKTQMADKLTLDRDHALMLAQMDEASELVGLLSYENNDKAANEAADITLQIVSDIWSRLPRAADEANADESNKLSAAS